MMVTIIMACGLILLVFNVIMILYVTEYGINDLEKLFYLKDIAYMHDNLNTGGCITLLLINHIVLLPWACIFWIYKLFSKRRQR